MKIVSLCGSCKECPMVKITDTQVEIGENDNTCVLTKAQWESLREKILKKNFRAGSPESGPRPHPLNREMRWTE